MDDIELIKQQNSYIPYLAPLNITDVKNFKGAGVGNHKHFEQSY